MDHIRKAAEGAAAIIAIGSCSAWAVLPQSWVNPNRRSQPARSSASGKPLSIFRAAAAAQLPC
ncbi:hypothetical protein ACNKHV_18955 [Shigella flexneri]